MREKPNRERKTPIKYKVTLNAEQKHVRQLIIDNQITLITGKAGSGKSLVTALAVVDAINKKQVDMVLITRPTVEVGKTLGYLPGDLDEKLNPYLEAFIENIVKCVGKVKCEVYVKAERLKGLATQFIRGKTIDEGMILVVEEAQNFTKGEMLAILTRLGKKGKIIVNGDSAQTDRHVNGQNGIEYLEQIAARIEGIESIELKENHRSDIVGKILDYEYEVAEDLKKEEEDFMKSKIVPYVEEKSKVIEPEKIGLGRQIINWLNKK